MLDKFNHFLNLMHEIYDLNAVLSLLSWDQHTYMPAGGAESRGHQLSVLAKIIHSRTTSQEFGDLLDGLKTFTSELDPDSDETCLINLMNTEFTKRKKVDLDWVVESENVKAEGNIAWRIARENSDFKIFKPWLEKSVELSKAYAEFFKPYDHIYDSLLNEFEPGMKTKDVQDIFTTLRPQQVEFITIINDKVPPEDGFLFQDFPQQSQWEFNIEVLTQLGYDWQRGRLDVTAHPFTTSMGLDDVRVTTRFDPKRLGMALFASIHECGHALYDLGFSRTLRRTELAMGASAAFHESQSRLYENLIGRSLSFWKYFYPKLKTRFSNQLNSISLDDFFKAINRVKPSLIRVEADEATYNLHIMLRLEIEIALLEGSLQVSDLPDAWNHYMRSYLGLSPKSDSLGVLQDIHWSIGLFGYFSTYALGNLISVLIWEKMVQDLPDIDEQMEHGQFEAILDWLGRNIHQHGRKYLPQDLILKVTGSKIDPAPYMRYLKKKYGEIYNL